MIDSLLWFDADAKRLVAVKVQRAAARYQQKFGRRPDVCYVNPVMLNGITEVDGIRLVAADNRLLNEFWIGEEAGMTSRASGNDHSEPIAEAEPPEPVVGQALDPLVHIDRWRCRNPECGYIGLQADTACPMCGYDGREMTHAGTVAPARGE